MKISMITILALLLTAAFTAASSPPGRSEAGTINGRVYCDHNRDGICDCAEKGLKRIHVMAFTDACAGSALQTIHTDEQGNFSFHVPRPGTYYVRVDLDYVCGGRIPTTSVCQQVELAAGETVSLEPFGYTVTGQ